MKCSKCGYLGFETSDRCRNCGYEFSLSPGFDLPELAIREEEPPDLDDYALVDAAAAPQYSGSASAVAVEPRPATRLTPRPTPSAMPLFAPGIDDDTPLITRASPPRAPLAVRKSTPEAARLRALMSPRPGNLDLGLDLDGFDTSPEPRMIPSDRAQAADADPSRHHEDASVGRRLAAVVIDSLILAVIDFVVIYFTMQICGVGIAEFGIVPKGPLIVFMVVQNVGYLVAFTAGGQTLGKMAAGIKVVSDSDAAMDIGCALKRTVMWLLLAVPAGLGLLSVMFEPDHRGLHDRFAGTRVVRATA